MTALVLADLVAACRVVALREAIVQTFGALLPDCEVKGHPGKVDFADVLAKDVFRAPALAVTATRALPVDRLSGSSDRTVDVAVYVVAEDMMLGTPERWVKREEVAWALSTAVADVAGDHASGRWGLENIGYPEAVEAKPLFTAVTYERGTVYFAVTWKQTLYEETSPLWNAGDDHLPPPGFGLPAPEPAP